MLEFQLVTVLLGGMAVHMCRVSDGWLLRSGNRPPRKTTLGGQVYRLLFNARLIPTWHWLRRRAVQIYLRGLQFPYNI